MRRRTAAPDPLEEDFQVTVVQLAMLCGWSAWHDADARRNPSGFSDLLLWLPPRLVVAELKRHRRVTTAAQRRHLELWRAVGAEALVWRPTPYRREQWPLVETAEAASLPPLWGGPPRWFEYGAVGRRLWADPAPGQRARDGAVAAGHLPAEVLAALPHPA